MSKVRACSALLIAGMLVTLAACTGTSPGTPSASAGGSGSGSTSTPPPSIITTLANGQPLPAGCPVGANARAQTVAFVAGGNAWALDPESGEATCLFPAPDPGAFTWNPRGDRALLSGLQIESVGGKQLRAGSSSTTPVSSWGHPIGKAVVYISPNGTRLLKIYPGTQRRDDITHRASPSPSWSTRASVRRSGSRRTSAMIQ